MKINIDQTVCNQISVEIVQEKVVSKFYLTTDEALLLSDKLKHIVGVINHNISADYTRENYPPTIDAPEEVIDKIIAYLDALPNMTTEQFFNTTGLIPIDDDMIRVNCKEAGKLGHAYCGVCYHGYPKFLVCEKCNLEMKGKE